MSNNPDTWTDFQTALMASEKYSGIGFMFSPPYFGVDIDDVEHEIHLFRSGETENIISEFVHTLASYTEYSQSGKGIHIICRGELPPGGRRKKNVEMYQTGRYFIMTGNDAAGYAEIQDCTKQIKSLHEKYIGGGREPTAAVRPAPIQMDDEEVLNAARRSKQGQFFDDLYHGHWQSYYRSWSEADMGFANMLAFWCRCDTEQMDRLFRSSGLMREKWLERRKDGTYGAATLRKAVNDCERVYEPKPAYKITIGQREHKVYTFDDMGNAERLSDAFGKTIRYSYVNRVWYYYDDRKWCVDQSGVLGRLSDEVVEAMDRELPELLKRPCDPDETEKQFRKHVKYSRSNKGKRAMLQETMHHVPILPNEMDKNGYLLNVQNGVLDLETGQLKNHDPKLYMSKIAYTEYTDKSDCPRWLQFLNEIFAGDRELIRYIQKAIGYTLTASIEEQCMFICFGNGRNGKSVFMDVLSTLMGDYALNIQPETIMIKSGSSGSANSDVARMKGARFVTSVEPSDGMKLNEGLIKQLTGGERVTARHLYGNEFEFIPEFKLWMGTNHKPIIRGTDTGIWRRVHLVPFTVTIPDDKVDRALSHHLRAELPGILNWAMDGCLLWQKEGLGKPKAVEEATREYRQDMDVLAAFIESCCELRFDERIKHSVIYQAYEEWASKNNEYVMSSRKFGREMSKKFEKKISHGQTVYTGLTLDGEHRPYQIRIGNG